MFKEEDSSFSHISEWLSVMNGAGDRMLIFLIGGKLNLKIIREISYEEGKKIAKTMDLDGSIECSSKKDENVEESFKLLTKMILNRIR